MKKTILYSLVTLAMLGSAGIASAHNTEGDVEVKASGGWGLGGLHRLTLDSRADVKAEFKAEHKDADKEDRAEWREKMKDAWKKRWADFEAFVGLSMEQIREERKDGKSMGEILEDQGKDRSETETFLEAQAETKIDAVVERKDLNDDQEDNLRVRIYAFIQTVLDRWFGND